MSSYKLPRGLNAVVNLTADEAGLIAGYTAIDNGSIVLNLETLKLRRYDHESTAFFDLGGGNIEHDIRATIGAGAINIGDKVLEDKTLTEVIEQLIAPLTQPTKTDSTLVLDGLPSSLTVEVGSQVNLTLGTTYTRGAIHSTSEGAVDVPLTGAATTATYYGPGNIVDNQVTFTATKSTEKWSVEQDFAQESSPYYDSEGNPSTIFDTFRGPSPGISVPAMAITVNDVTGKYQYWWSAGTIPTNTDAVRALPNYGFYPTSQFNIAIPQGTKPVSFFIPDDGDTVKIYHVESSNNDVTSFFSVTPITVEDANGVDVDYLSYSYIIPGIGYTADATFKVIIT